MSIAVQTHMLVPKHSKLSDSEKIKLLEQNHISTKQLPKIVANDPAIHNLNVKEGDIIKVERKSKTAGTAVYYRVVVDG